MPSSCTYFKAVRLGTRGVWNFDFLSLPVAVFLSSAECFGWEGVGCAAPEENSLYSQVGRLKLY